MVSKQRYVIYGAGAIGGVIGGCLHLAGFNVHLIARGAHLEALQSHGLSLHRPGESWVLPIPASLSPSELSLTSDDVVILAMKSQHTMEALEALGSAAPSDITLVCAQNGVNNERLALRHFPNVYGMNVTMPATHLEPGVVIGEGTPVAGVLDIGRYPAGADDLAHQIASDLRASNIDSQAHPDVMAYKYAKLRVNTGNAIDAVCGQGERQTELAKQARAEALAVYEAANIPVASPEQVQARRGDFIMGEVDGHPRGGSSSWQSLARSAGSIEVDYLSGEIVLLGRLHGVPTPVNETALRLAKELARDKLPPASMPVDTVEAMVAAARSAHQ